LFTRPQTRIKGDFRISDDEEKPKIHEGGGVAYSEKNRVDRNLKSRTVRAEEECKQRFRWDFQNLRHNIEDVRKTTVGRRNDADTSNAVMRDQRGQLTIEPM
jgi:hypothetical protein